MLFAVLLRGSRGYAVEPPAPGARGCELLPRSCPRAPRLDREQSAGSPGPLHGTDFSTIARLPPARAQSTQLVSRLLSDDAMEHAAPSEPERLCPCPCTGRGCMPTCPECPSAPPKRESLSAADHGFEGTVPP